MKIITIPNPILKKKCKPVNKINGEVKNILDDMLKTMYSAGIGLAAPQIGKSIRIFVIDGSSLNDEKMSNFKKVFINPLTSFLS